MSYTKLAAKRQFEKWSRSYDRSIFQPLLFEPSHNRLLERLRIGRSARVLDIGCGTGVLADRIAREFPGCEVWGLDFCRPMLHRAIDRVEKRVILVQADSEQLPFASNSFDLVLNTHCFHHFPNQAEVIREMFRVLGDGGQAFIVDGDRDRPWGRLIFDVLVVAFEGPVQHASAARMRELVQGAGFSSVRHERGGTIAPFLLTQCVARKAASVAARAGTLVA